VKKRIIVASASVLSVIVLVLVFFAFFDVEGFIFRNKIVAFDYDGAEEWEIPIIGINDADRLERLTHGRTIVLPGFYIENDGKLLSWRLNGRLLPRSMFDPGERLLSLYERPPGKTFFTNWDSRAFTLKEGENELIIRARGTTGLIAERRLSITSDQTTPQELRIIPTFYRASISYDPENPMLVTVTLEIEEGDFSNVLVFADTYYSENFEVVTAGERTFKFTVELKFRGRSFDVDTYGQDIRLVAENEWGITWGGVSIKLTDVGPLISGVYQEGSTQGFTSNQWATSLQFPPPHRLYIP